MSENEKYNYLVKQWEIANSKTIDKNGKKEIDECFEEYIEKIQNHELKLSEYTNRKSDESTQKCDYLCTFIENKSSKFYGSASAGSATYFGIKMNDDENTYYISKKVTEDKELKNASSETAQKEFGKIITNLKELVPKEKLSDDNKKTIFEAVEINNVITSKVMLRKIVAMHNTGDFLYSYSDEAIDIIYAFFVENGDAKLNIEKNYELTKTIKKIFSIEGNNVEDMIKLSRFIWSIFGATITFESKNMILHGAPGTGKTYMVKNTIKNMILKEGGTISKQLVFTQFHPSYSYEDFIDGIKPTGIENGQMKFELKNGSFKELCRLATIKLKEERKGNKKDEELTKFFFVADEINRAELSRVFGELLICLEEDYRIDFDKNGNILKEESLIVTQNAMLDNNPVYMQKDKNYFGVPVNLYFIGTMNDIDRSVDSFDMALRRRFYWKEIRCNYNFIDSLFNDVGYTKICKDLNRYITGYKEEKSSGLLDKVDSVKGCEPLRLGTSFELGHAYFKDIKKVDKKNINKLWNSKLEPLLKEYLRAEYAQDELVGKLQEANKIFTLENKLNDTDS